MDWGTTTTSDDPRRADEQDEGADLERPRRRLVQLPSANSASSSSSSHWSPLTPSSLSPSTLSAGAKELLSSSLSSSSTCANEVDATPRLSPPSSPPPASSSPLAAGVLHHRRQVPHHPPLPLPPHPRWGTNNHKTAWSNDNMSLPLLSHHPPHSSRPRFPKRKTSQLPTSPQSSWWSFLSFPVISHLRRLGSSTLCPSTPSPLHPSTSARRWTPASARRMLSQALATFVVARFAWAVFWMHDTVTHAFPPHYEGGGGGSVGGSVGAGGSALSSSDLSNSLRAEASDPAAASAMFSLKDPILDTARRIITVREDGSRSGGAATGSGSGGGIDRTVEIISRRRPPRGPDQLHKRRRERTTPAGFRPDDEALRFAAAFRHDPHLDAHAQVLPSRQGEAPRMAKLCRQSGLDAASYALVLGVDGVTTSFLSVAAKHCGLKYVMLVDPMVPNLRRERLRTLQRHVRALQRPDLGLSLDFRSPADAGTLLRDRWFSKPRGITHVVAFQSPHSYQDSYPTLSEFMGESSHALFHMHQSFLAWHQALTWVQSQATPKKQSPPILLYVSLTGTEAVSREMDRGRHVRRQRLQSHLSQVLSRAHHSTQQQGRGDLKRVPTYAHLVIPADAVVGPYCSESLPSLSDESRVVYVTDAAVAMFEALAASRQPRAGPTKNSGVPVWKASVEHGEAMSIVNWTQFQNAAAATAAAGTNNSTVLMDRSANEYKVLVMAQHDMQWRAASTFLDSTHAGSTAVASPVDGLPSLTMALSSDLVEMSGTSFPCSSSCRTNAGIGSSNPCQPSAWELLRPLSRKATAGCTYVVYLVIVDQPLDELPEPSAGRDEYLCRVAFVHASSQLVQRELITKWKEESQDGTNHSEFEPHQWNGRLESNQWTLVWLNNTRELSLADAALLKIDPSRMFADSVKRTLYAEYFDYVRPSDATLARVIRNVDRGGLPWRRQIERRSGVPAISRWSYLEPEPAKRSILFATEPLDMPKSVNHFVKMAGTSTYFPAPQLRYYEQLAHAVQVNDFRPESEIRATVYESFPLEWVSTAALVHDLVSPPAHELRCRWYDEYLHWGGNRDAEELALSMVLATMRIGGELGLPVSGSVDAPNQDLSWYPILNATDGSRQSMKLNRKGDAQECFVRVMRHRKRK